MSTIINATTTNGVVIQPDNSGSLVLQTNSGTTALTIDTSQRAAFVAGTAALPAITTTGDTNTGMFFPAADTIAFAEGGVEAMRLDSSGNVGIGTTSPSQRLDVKATTGANILKLSATTTTNECYQTFNNAAGAFYVGLDNSTGATFGSAYSANFYQSGAYPMIFWTNNAERMRIDASGNVLVGTTTEGAGAGFATKVAISGVDALLSKTAGVGATDAAPARFWHNATSGNNVFVLFATETSYTNRGSIDYNRGANQTRYNTTSDQRLKENIVDAPSAINLINSVKIRSFDWKETGFHVDYGVIAQELNEVAPDAVSEGIDNEDGTIKQSWGVDTSVLVPALIKSIQEQQTIINDLKARVETLEAK